MGSSVDQKKIALNTLMLAIRFGVMTLVKLYTVNVVLGALGQVDYGIFNTVAAVVLTFSFLNDTMSTACQRFLAHGIVKEDREEIRNIFSMCVMAFAVIALTILLLSETGGLWLLHRKIQLDGRSMSTAHLVYQMAIVSFMFTIMRTPFQGMIIMREKFNVYTCLSIFEVLGQFAVAILISHSGQDRLVLYSVLMMTVSITVASAYCIYCTSAFKESRFRFYWNRGEFREILSFTSWNMFGALAMNLKSYGISLLINVFFANAMVAARTLAYKVYGTLLEFSGNITTAIRPQIIKSYTDGNKEDSFNLVYQGSKFAFYLFLSVALPIFMETPLILDIWLKDVPEYTVLFTRLCIINGLFDVLVTPLAATMQAYGKIMTYQIVTSLFIMLVVPVSWIFLRMGFPPETVFYVSIVICALAIVIRLLFINHYTGMSVTGYFRSVLLPAAVVTICAGIVPTILELYMADGLIRFFTVSAVCIIMTAATAYTLGMTRTERKHVNEYAVKLLHKIGF